MSNPEGLSEAAVRERKLNGLQNRIHISSGRSYIQILRQHLFTFINTVLFTIAITLVAMDRAGDGLATMSLVVFNVGVGLFQEIRAKRKLQSIALIARPQATVIREGVERVIGPGEIVLDDVLIVRSGDQVMVDGRVLSTESAEVDESLLTGESEPVEKHAGDEVLSGSFCVTGELIFEAEKIGGDSLVNRLSSEAKSARSSKTPLQRDIDQLVRIMLFVVVPLGLLIAMSLLFHDVPLVEGMRIAAVVVALIPQGLFFMTTVSYAIGAVRVSNKKALVQQINAIESMSHVNVLCLDKTGTLTTNRMQMDELIPVGNSSTSHQQEVRELLGSYASSSSDHNRTMDAIREGCGGEEQELLEQIPFHSDRKWSAQGWGGRTFLLGAPEILGAHVNEYARIADLVNKKASAGSRVVLFAEVPKSVSIRDEAGEPGLPDGLAPLGLLCFSEEVRDEAQETITQFRQLGIEPKVISGDHPETVAALCRKVGLDGDLKAVSGIDLASYDESEFEKAALNTTVFGRITPEQKQKLVEVLQRNGAYVAMIGDGVNDVLALKHSNVAVSMQSGSQATRAVADIVLMKDSFEALPAAFHEGQRVVKGMEDVVRLLLVRSFYLALAIMFTQIIGLEFPLTPKHNAVLALLTVGLPLIAIAAWARPGKPASSVVSAGLRFVYSPAVTISVVILGIYFFFLETSGDIDVARSALTTAGVLCGLVLIPFVEPPTRWWVAGDVLSGDWRPTILAAGLLLAFVLTMAIQPIREFAELEVLGWFDYLGIVAVVIFWTFLQRQIWRTDFFRRTLIGHS